MLLNQSAMSDSAIASSRVLRTEHAQSYVTPRDPEPCALLSL
jgi:hypothetical protein